MHRNVLIVAESFPPVNHIAARRFGWLAPFLEDNGWRPWVLTMHSSGPLESGLPEQQVIRIGDYPHAPADLPAFRPQPRNFAARMAGAVVRPIKTMARKSGFRLNTLYGGQFGWYRRVVREEAAVLQRLPPIDLVIGSFSPMAGLVLARRFAHRLSVPWIADFRDMAALRPDGSNRASRAIDRRIERWVVRSAAGFTTVSPTLAELLEREYGRPAATIYNGWTGLPEETEGCHILTGVSARVSMPAGAQALACIRSRLKPVLQRPADGRESMAHSPDSPPGRYLFYAGRLYSHRMPGMTRLLEAMARTSELQLVVRSLGPVHLETALRETAARLGMNSRVQILPPCDPDVADAEADRAFANVVVEDLDDRDAAARGTLTGKLLKLLPQRPAIVGIARADSDIGPILAHTRKGRLCATTDAISALLGEIGRAPIAFAGDADAIAEYSMRRQAQRLCGFFEATLDASALKDDGRGTPVLSRRISA